MAKFLWYFLLLGIFDFFIIIYDIPIYQSNFRPHATVILEFGETQHTSHETECNAEMHCGGVAVVETEYYKGDIPQASSCGLFRSSEARKKVAVATSSVFLL